MTQPHVSELLELALSQEGDRYVFGVENRHTDPDPVAHDCSEFVEWLGARLGIEPVIPDGSWMQARHVRKHDTRLSVADGIEIPGALLFRFSSDPYTGPRPSSAHVAISLGGGQTIEARGTRYGVGVFPSSGRGWTQAGLIPGLDYTERIEMAQGTPSDWAAGSWKLANEAGILTEDSHPRDPITVEQFVVFLNRTGVIEPDSNGRGRVDPDLKGPLDHVFGGRE